MDLNAYYNKWNQITKDISQDDEPTSQPTLTKDKVKDLKFGLGEPLTEAQFKAHCAKNKTSKVVAQHKA